ncbi:MAG: PqqD family protein [bacterium]|nr:PqqD family protein [bacterium]
MRQDNRIFEREDCPWRRIMDEVVIVVPGETAYMHSLNSVGANIWELIDGKMTVDNIVDELLKRYKVTPERARKDLNELIDKLLEAKLIHKVK